MKKVIGWIIGILIFLGIVGSFSSSNNKSNLTDTPSPNNTTNTQPQAQISDTPKEQPEAKPEVKAESTTNNEMSVPPPAPKQNCNPNYSPCVPNASYDLDCPDIGFQVTVTGVDVYHLDRDGDGVGCESY